MIEENPNMSSAYIMYDRGWVVVKIFNNQYGTGTDSSLRMPSAMSISGNWCISALPGEAAQFVRLGLMDLILRSFQTKQNEILARLEGEKKKPKQGRTEIILHD